MRMLFINSFSSLRKKKLQLIGIILLVFLSTCVYTMMNMAVDKVEDRYNEYLVKQNVEDLSISVNIDYKNSFTYSDILNIKGNYQFAPDEQYIINLFLMCTSSNNCTEEFLGKTDLIFQKYDINKDKNAEILKDLSRKYKFDYEISISKLLQEGDLLYKVFPFNENKKINKPYLLKSSFPKEKGEITVLEGFAKSNNLKIKDKLIIGEKEYTIVGFAYASDHIYPLINISTPIFNQEKHNIIFMNNEDYLEFKGIEEKVNSIKFKTENKADEMLSKENKIKLSTNDQIRSARIKTPEVQFKSNRIFAESFLYLLLAVSAIIILVIAKKRIDDERLQVGVLKALGYSRSSIALSYLLYPIIGGIVGGILGFTFGYLLNPIVTNVFVNYFNMPIVSLPIDYSYLIKSTVIPVLVLSVLTYLIFLYMLRHDALYLLKEGSNIKVNIFSRIVSKLTSFLPYKERVRISLANRSLGKLLIVSLSSFLTGLLIVFILITHNLFSYIVGSSFKNINYDYVVEYIKPIDKINLVDDLVLSRTYDVSKVYDKDGKIKELNERKDGSKNTISIEGIDKELHYFELFNSNNKKISTDLSEGKIIINKNISKVMGIEKGDKIVFKDLNFKYTVFDISESFNGFVSYVDRKEFSDALKTSYSYNKKYSKDSVYSNYSNIEKEEIDNILSLFSVKDLEKNMNVSLDTYSVSLYIVISFASLMIFIIVLIIANIVIEENRRTIALMKAIGYKKKEINSIVLNMYTPFIIISYIISIPVMIKILEYIVSILSKDIGLAIPISISYLKAFIGLLILLVGYYIAMFISKRTLNKIPLAVALKRE